MDITSLIIFLAIGALAGWLAGNIMKGIGFGVIGNIIVGVIGGSWGQTPRNLNNQRISTSLIII